ncbi:nucleotidyltransferase family protein [Paenibacillus sp. JX-17]|uniref:Nucleotidyltransferase family protein n=1 Tax=Paenibacillus lacisoli TaxID=3064525 RepID=A0ABT9C8K4_9BACL|nr:nucleotidyltransferase family protein [Paenibacillus sp. JX-17]MDO7905580.1 nucleotidyltransferase family protein [Paenibacillus sp. JX-17]
MKMPAGIILAAGRSSRMGCNKLAIPLGESAIPLGGLVIRSALRAGLDPVIVIGSEPALPLWLQESLRAEERAERVQYVYSAESRQGMAYSIRAGVAAVRALRLEAFILLLGDQPLVNEAHITRLVQLKQSSCAAADYAAYEDRGQVKPPILFSYRMYNVLARLEGDQGAKQVIHSAQWKGRHLTSGREIFLDADTPSQLEEIRAYLRCLP